MTRRDAFEFRGYLRNCTDAQVFGVWSKEYDAQRYDFAALAAQELGKRTPTPQVIELQSHIDLAESMGDYGC